jgi:hypothetical protein
MLTWYYPCRQQIVVKREKEKAMQVRAKSIAANVSSINRQMGGSQKPIYGGIVPGMEEEGAREIAQVVIELAPGTKIDGDEYILPNGLRTKVDRNGTFCQAEYAE